MIDVIIQARLGSNRFPGKVLKKNKWKTYASISSGESKKI